MPKEAMTELDRKMHATMEDLARFGGAHVY